MRLHLKWCNLLTKPLARTNGRTGSKDSTCPSFLTALEDSKASRYNLASVEYAKTVSMTTQAHEQMLHRRHLCLGGLVIAASGLLVCDSFLELRQALCLCDWTPVARNLDVYSLSPLQSLKILAVPVCFETPSPQGLHSKTSPQCWKFRPIKQPSYLGAKPRYVFPEIAYVYAYASTKGTSCNFL